jgi:hypothetical protein
MAVGFPTKVSYANGDVFSASDINDTNGTINLLTSSTLSVAGGKNIVINGGMDIWQRGLSGTANSYSGGAGYNVDRWQSGYTSGALTVSKQGTSDSTNLPTIQYCARVQRNLAQTSVNALNFAQTIETAQAYQLAGKAVTLSFYARKGANYSASANALGVILYTGTGSDQSIWGFTGSTAAISTSVTLTSTWQRFTATATLASNASEIGVLLSYTPTGTAGANDYYEVTGVQLELGSTATTFSRAGGTIQGELAACQRYYFLAGKENTYSVFGHGIAYTTTQAYVSIIFPVTMRIAPSTLDYSTVAGQGSPGGSTTAATNLTINTANTSSKIASLTITVGSALWTSAYPATILSNNSTSGYVGLSAEL